MSHTVCILTSFYFTDNILSHASTLMHTFSDTVFGFSPKRVFSPTLPTRCLLPSPTSNVAQGHSSSSLLVPTSSPSRERLETPPSLRLAPQFFYEQLRGCLEIDMQLELHLYYDNRETH